MWNLDEGIDFCQWLEKALVGQLWHCGLTGGVLYRGASDKDLDVILYPHRTGEGADEETLRLGLNLQGVTNWKKCEHNYDDKDVWKAEWCGRRIDFFFLK